MAVLGVRLAPGHSIRQLHGLKGWVRNRPDPLVRAVFSGPADLVEVMLKACCHGPAGAFVEDVEILEARSLTPTRGAV